MPRLHPHSLQHLRWLALPMLGMLLMACNTTAGNAATEAAGERIIIAFTDARPADSAATLHDLAHAGGVPLRYVGPVGPRTHVYATIDTLPEAALQDLLTRLGRAAFIDYAEVDRRVRPASP